MTTVEVILLLGAYVLGCLACILWRLAVDRVTELETNLAAFEAERLNERLEVRAQFERDRHRFWCSLRADP